MATSTSSQPAAEGSPRSEPGAGASRRASAQERSSILPSDGLTAYERWELPAVEGPGEGSIGAPMTASQLAELQKQAYEEGFAEGRSDGYANGVGAGEAAIRAELAPSVAALATALGSLAEPFAALDAEVEEALVHLAMSVAEQLVLRELTVAPEAVGEVVRQAVDAVPTAHRQIRVELHPADLALVVSKQLLGPDTGAWELRENAGVTRGGCRIETETSRVDASVEARLASVVAHVLGGPWADPSVERSVDPSVDPSTGPSAGPSAGPSMGALDEGPEIGS